VRRPQGPLLDVGGVLLRTPRELLDDFERRHGWSPGDAPVAVSGGPVHRPAVALGPARRPTSGEYVGRRAAEIARLLGVRLTWPEFTRALFEALERLAIRPEGRPLVVDARSAGLRTGILTSS
jgi:hypothetical protein